MNINNCQDCGKPFKGRNKTRTKPSSCYVCLGIQTKSYELSNLCKSILRQPPKEPAPDELCFEDDPRAEKYNENEVGKVITNSVGYVYSESVLAEQIKDKDKNIE
tara:strand:+ start:718 stop:1032 length:315 start_codon:yes stop_codon:yes gene_type:complete